MYISTLSDRRSFINDPKKIKTERRATTDAKEGGKMTEKNCTYENEDEDAIMMTEES